MYERLTNENYFPVCFFQLVVMWLEPIPAAQGTRRAPTAQDALPHTTALTQTEQFRHTNSPNVHILGCGWKQEYLEKTCIDMERMCKLHTKSGPGQESIFFLILIMKWCWMACHYLKICCAFIALRTLYSMYWLVNFSLC